MPFESGWYGEVLRCLMPFLFRKVPNYSLVKFVALSDTITSGEPNVANNFLNKELVVADVAELVICTSNHLE